MTINSIANTQLNTSMMRISTGQRINSAADDAAGLAISERLTAQIRGLDRGTQNVMDMQNLVNTAEGGLSNISDSLHRVRELTVQAQNGVLTDSDRQNIQFEIDQLLNEIDSATQRTEFNGQRLLDGSFSREDGRGLHTAADASGRGPTVNIGNMSASMLLGPESFNVVEESQARAAQGAVVPPPETDGGAMVAPPEDGYEGIVPPIGQLPPAIPAPQAQESDLLRRLDDAITMVSRERSYLGAMNNRFDTTIASNQIANLNMASARSGIRDADIALEVMRMNEASILEQAQLAAQRRDQENQGVQVASLLA